MREKTTEAQIDNVLNLVKELWNRYPHQRLGQVLLNVCRTSYGSMDRAVLWNLDEDDLRVALKDVLDHGW